MSAILEELARIQKVLKAPKTQRNNFGNYNYRSCEDILEAVKLVTTCAVTLSDDIVELRGDIYVKATATLINAEGEQYSTTAFAREPVTKKGADPSQITGAASSYSRKYALNGLFSIDDTKDADATNNHKDEPPHKQEPNPVQQNGATEKPWYNSITTHLPLMVREINAKTKTASQIIVNLEKTYKVSNAVKDQIKLLEQ